MALQRLPYEYDFVMYSGATFKQKLEWIPGGEPVDFTGWDAWLTYGPTLNDPLGEITVANGGITLDTQGGILLTFSDEQTAEFTVLDIPKKAGVSKLQYAFSLKSPAGDVIRFMRGELLIQHDVPRPK